MITGIGVVSPNGIGAENFGRACIEGKSGIVRLAGIDTQGLKTIAAAQVIDFDPLTAMDSVELRRVPRMVPMALAASREALAAARIELDPNDVEAQRQIGKPYRYGAAGPDSSSSTHSTRARSGGFK